MKLHITATVAAHCHIGVLPVEGLPPEKWPPNPERKSYLITCTDGPTGFAIRVTAGNASYIVQRRVRASGPGAVIRATVGKVTEMTVQQARKKAQEMLDQIEETGRAPGPDKRDRDERDLSLDQVLDAYRHELVHRKRPAKASSLRSYDKAVRKLVNLWPSRRVNDLLDEEVIEAFDAINVKAPTTAEQTFRWASTATSFAIEREARLAHRRAERPVMLYNPFNILRTRYRTRQELENHYKKVGRRRPLTLQQTLGPWLQAIYNRRKENRTGCDYLLLATLWGCRSQECSDLMWLDQITPEEIDHVSFVDLDAGYVLMRDTKNRLDHTVPICRAARRILEERRAIRDEEAKADLDTFRRDSRKRWVFPPRSESRLRKTPHYKDSKSLRSYICRDAGLVRWVIKTDPDGTRFQIPAPTVGMHDLRRTFGGVTDALHFSEQTTKRLLNHFTNARSQSDQRIEKEDAVTPNVARSLQNTQHLSDVTTRYTEPDAERKREAMQTVEQAILSTYPPLFNMLIATSPEVTPMQHWEPEPLKWPEPRPGIEVRYGKDPDPDAEDDGVDGDEQDDENDEDDEAA
ncbi:integrase family protein [Burkholderia vietnamiensis]|uniref:tyrosine-type recombinase/integrase n=1 Tax=Burkholderia vietnamiensis TaxID=60552 RepID=UPI001B9CAF57|nr:integrase arm-type DNA-binding domain-containing protein [Burkholderia vietnamiensis]MBR8082657.1 integrase family protein [Burkholderia vietnamiensis]